MRIILASQSEIRKRALNLLGLPFETMPSYFDETTIRHQDPLQMAKLLSEAKALTIGDRLSTGLIIASDAFVVLNSRVLEKPKDLNAAHEMLTSLSGKSYDFVTGLAVYNAETKTMLSTVDTCKITFRNLSKDEITHYITNNSVLKFAGAHDTDGVIRFSERVEGNCNFYTALPVNKLIEFLRLNKIKI